MTETESRIDELEQLISTLRHDIRNALSTARLVTDRMRDDPDQRMQKFGATIDRSTQRILDFLEQTRKIVPPKGG